MNKIIEQYKNDLEAGYRYVTANDNVFTKEELEFLEFYQKQITVKPDHTDPVINDIEY